MNQIELLMSELLAFDERAKIQKGANAEELRAEVRAFIKKARALPDSDTVIMRKIVIEPPAAVSAEWDLLRTVLESKKLRIV
jgi:hypothetical protein